MIKNILFDFDGVILDSMPIREFGFKEIFKEHNPDLIEKLLDFHNKNGGLSRYIKIRYFYEKLLNTNITEEEVQILADKFSVIMKKELINKKYLINETVDFIEKNYKNYFIHIVSGSDEKELQYLCQELGISEYFKSIHGSPTIKNDLVKNIIVTHGYNCNETILIGDSINDYEAATINNLDFYGFNNSDMEKYSKVYLTHYDVLT